MEDKQALPYVCMQGPTNDETMVQLPAVNSFFSWRQQTDNGVILSSGFQEDLTRLSPYLESSPAGLSGRDQTHHRHPQICQMQPISGILFAGWSPLNVILLSPTETWKTRLVQVFTDFNFSVNKSVISVV